MGKWENERVRRWENEKVGKWENEKVRKWEDEKFVFDSRIGYICMKSTWNSLIVTAN
jgi:hypothetical protein